MELNKVQAQQLADLLEDIDNIADDIRIHLEVIASKLTPSEALIAERAAIQCLSVEDTTEDAWKRGLYFALIARMVKNAAIKGQDEALAVREALYRGEG